MPPALHLLPKPRHLKLTGELLSLETLPVLETLGPAAVRLPGDEAYRLEISPAGIRIFARNECGLHCARATLAQLRKHPQVPALEIDDSPLFAHRGVMLDISRDRVPTMPSLFELVDQLASWKMNHLQLYVEHTLAYTGHEDAWRGASPLTLEELAALDAYCLRKGVSLNANQNCLGHFERWIKHPRYAPLAESAGGQMVNGDWYVRPNTLCPLDERVPALIEDLLRQQLPLCSGPFANIGCDEPWDLGRGRSRAACEAEGKGRVFSRHVSRVADKARALGKRPQYWCDPHPNEDDGLPRDLVALVWGYEDLDDLHTRAAAHRAVGREVWVAPGTSCWNSATGRTWNRRAILDHAARTPGAAGFLCTAWGDGGHRQPWPITLAGFADAASAAWAGPGAYDDSALGLHAFGSAALGPWLTRLGNVDAEICRGERPDWHGNLPAKRPVHNATALWREMETNLFEPQGNGDIAAWREVGERLDALRVDLPAGLPALLAEECVFALDLSRWTVDRAIVRRTQLTQDARKALAARMVDLIEIHRRQWLARSRYGGLEDSSARFIPHAARW